MSAKLSSGEKRDLGNWLKVWILLQLLWPILNVPAVELATKKPAAMFSIFEQRVLDRVPTEMNGKEQCPAFRYVSAASHQEKVLLIKLPRLCGRSASKGQDFISLGIDEHGISWKNVSLKGWNSSRTSHLGDPQAMFDKSGNLILAWEGEESGDSSLASKIVVKQLQIDGNWSGDRVLSDSEAEEISGFTIAALPESGFAILWTDGREKHLASSTHPEDEGFPKVFGRQVEMGELGPLFRVTRDKGKYSAWRVRLRIDRTGRQYAIWDQIDRRGYAQLYLSTRLGSTWSDPVKVTNDAYEHRTASYHLDFDVTPTGDGGALIVYDRDEPYLDVVYREYKSGVLGAVTRIAAKSCRPRVASASDGSIQLVYEEFDPYFAMNQYQRPATSHLRHLYYREFWDGRWSEQQELARDVFLGSSSIVVDATDRVHIIWQQLVDGEGQLFQAVGHTERTK